jgi:FkbM family methyltransferase
MSTFDNITYEGACPGFHSYIISGRSQPYPRELKLVKKYMDMFPNKNNTYLDIGGHIGTTALPYAKIFKNIIVYEPNVVSYNHLVNNIKINKCTNIIAKPVGVSNVISKAIVVKHGANSGCYYIKDSTEDTAIDIIRLDDEKIDDSVDFIKIDTEGNELYVLMGAKELIQKYKPLIQVETNKTSNKLFNYDKQEIFKFMTDIGYKVFDDNGNDPLFYYDIV